MSFISNSRISSVDIKLFSKITEIIKYQKCNKYVTEINIKYKTFIVLIYV